MAEVLGRLNIQRKSALELIVSKIVKPATDKTQIAALALDQLSTREELMQIEPERYMEIMETYIPDPQFHMNLHTTKAAMCLYNNTPGSIEDTRALMDRFNFDEEDIMKYSKIREELSPNEPHLDIDVSLDEYINSHIRDRDSYQEAITLLPGFKEKIRHGVLLKILKTLSTGTDVIDGEADAEAFEAYWNLSTENELMTGIYRDIDKAADLPKYLYETKRELVIGIIEREINQDRATNAIYFATLYCDELELGNALFDMFVDKI